MIKYEMLRLSVTRMDRRGKVPRSRSGVLQAAAGAKAWKRQNRSLVHSVVSREVWLESRGHAGELMLERESSKT